MAVKTYSTFGTGFRGTVQGAIQTVVYDQPGQGVPGMLPFASDNDLVDSYLANGDLPAGCGIVLGFNSNTAEQFQQPGQLAALPAANNLTIADFAGIVVFDENMQSNADGVPGWANGRVARVVRPGRAGGRVYVKAIDAIDRTTATVNWVVQGGTDGKYAAGEFAPAALAGNATVGYSVAITTAKFISSAAVGSVAIIELG
jgi:hypothetical protein